MLLPFWLISDKKPNINVLIFQVNLFTGFTCFMVIDAFVIKKLSEMIFNFTTIFYSTTLYRPYVMKYKINGRKDFL